MPPPRLPLPLFSLTSFSSSSSCFRITPRLLSPLFLTPARCIFPASFQCRQFGRTSPRYDAELPSAKEEKRSSLAKNVSSRLDHMQAVIFTAGQKINDLTGYSGIEALKKDIDAQESNLLTAKALVQEAKVAYKAAIARRSDSQKEVNELLTRKNTWSPTDLERFTSLYRSDHANEQAEIQAQNRLTEVEKEVESASSLLSKSILTRYHEEQVWSDKIRRASTWGTWMLMGINILLFVVVQLGLEPWKRRRLVNNFEEKVRGMLKEEKGAAAPAQAVTVEKAIEEVLSDTKDTADAMEKALGEDILEVVEGATATALSTGTVADEEATGEPAENVAQAERESEPDPEEGMNVYDVIMYRLGNYFTEQVISLPQVDMTFYVIEGFVVGVMSTITLLAVIMLLD
ncbi:hypothetical protein ABW20_dc0105379 [Dactylellina cionopaga]|nr:hypothetical protein ABW20_dc0105379 [Dactylellina cionopaga]